MISIDEYINDMEYKMLVIKSDVSEMMVIGFVRSDA